jgi:hypothetical protein
MWYVRFHFVYVRRPDAGVSLCCYLSITFTLPVMASLCCHCARPPGILRSAQKTDTSGRLHILLDLPSFCHGAEIPTHHLELVTRLVKAVAIASRSHPNLLLGISKW